MSKAWVLRTRATYSGLRGSPAGSQRGLSPTRPLLRAGEVPARVSPVHQVQLGLRGLAGLQAEAPLLQAPLPQALQDGGQALGTLDRALGAAREDAEPSPAPRAAAPSPPAPGPTHSSHSSLAAVMASW